MRFCLKEQTHIDDVPFEMEVFLSLSKCFRSTLVLDVAFPISHFLHQQMDTVSMPWQRQILHLISFSVWRLNKLFISGGCPKGTLMDTGKTQGLGWKRTPSVEVENFLLGKQLCC